VVDKILTFVSVFIMDKNDLQHGTKCDHEYFFFLLFAIFCEFLRFFLPSSSVSLVDSDLLFLSFISLSLSFYLRFRDSIALVVSNLTRSCDGYVSIGCITSSSAAISFPVMPLWPGAHTKDTFSSSLSNCRRAVIWAHCCFCCL
jgi:hypothetical protein